MYRYSYDVVSTVYDRWLCRSVIAKKHAATSYHGAVQLHSAVLMQTHVFLKLMGLKAHADGAAPNQLFANVTNSRP